ncbi:MAG: hypothetical protein AB1631_31500 [Acidobacteriota bacterium]
MAQSVRLRGFLFRAFRLTHRATGFRRKLLCTVLILSLLSLPGSHVAEAFSAMADSTLEISTRPVRWIASLFDSFKSKPTRRQRLTLIDRINQVSSIRVTPFKSVGYQGDSLTFSALGLDSSADTVQGVRFEWESSDPDKLKIDNTGEATLLQPGMVRVICRAGSSQGAAFVLIRPGSRRPQTDQEWDADQDSFTVTDSSTGSTASDGQSADLIESLLGSLAPTAFAQNQGCTWGSDNSDFGYDELWSEPRNLTGNPRYRAAEGFRMGSVLPEGSNFNAAIPLYGLGGRGLGASLTLFYNSRVWSRHGSAITFNPTQGWPFAGFSLGFGRLFTYGSGSSTKYVWIDPDGTRRYLGVGSDTTTTTYQTSDGSHITFVGSKSSGGSLYFNDGTKVTITVINNRLLPTKIRDSNGNYILISYKTYNASTFPWRQAINYVTDTLGRQLQFNYDSCANLISITVPAFSSGTNTVVQFDYQSIGISNSFSGLTVENLPTGTVPALRHIFFDATDTGYKLDYSAYGMVYNISMRKDMSIDANGAITDGTERAAINFNYPTVGSSLTDAPAFTQRTETATNSPTATYYYSTADYGTLLGFLITQPDGSGLYMTRVKDASSVANGLMNYSVVTKDGQTYAFSWIGYANDPGGSVQVQSVTRQSDAAGQQSLTTFDYDQYGNVSNVREYGFQVSGQWQVRRRTRYVYKTDTSYINCVFRR